MLGTVHIWERDRGYGFLRVDETRRQVFLHVREVLGGAHDPPQVGDLVEFDLTETPRGPRAVGAVIVKRAASAQDPACARPPRGRW